MQNWDNLDGPELRCHCPEPGGCDCYGQGYADGKSKAHFEIREMVTGHDFARCGCEACFTLRIVLPNVFNMLVEKGLPT